MSSAPERPMPINRILVVTRNLPPLLGGMERLNWHLVDELAKTAEVRVVGPAEAEALAPKGVTLYPVPLKPIWRFLLSAACKALASAKQWRPDVVLAGSGLTAPIALLAARACGARSATYVHGLDITVRHPIYRAIWLPAIRRVDTVIANSHSTAEFAREAGISGERIQLVHPGVVSPAPICSAEQIGQFKAKHGLQDKSVLISVGRLTTRKGLREFVQYALPQIVAQRPDALLLIVGSPPIDALHAGQQTPASILETAMTAGVGEHVRYIGQITDFEELLTAYQSATAHVFPVRNIPGDTEGFGMVAVEAAASGVPTVAFATGGVVDAVAEGVSGYLAPPNDYDRLAQRILQVINNPGALRESCLQHGEGFSWQAFGNAVFTALAPRLAR